MKTLAILAALGAGLLATTAQAAILSAPVSTPSSDVQMAGVICGPGMHLVGVVCVRNHVKVCPMGWHLGVGGVCRR